MARAVRIFCMSVGAIAAAYLFLCFALIPLILWPHQPQLPFSPDPEVLANFDQSVEKSCPSGLQTSSDSGKLTIPYDAEYPQFNPFGCLTLINHGWKSLCHKLPILWLFHFGAARWSTEAENNYVYVATLGCLQSVEVEVATPLSGDWKLHRNSVVVFFKIFMKFYLRIWWAFRGSLWLWYGIGWGNPGCESTTTDFFFGLATAPAHVEDNLNDSWVEFAQNSVISWCAFRTCVVANFLSWLELSSTACSSGTLQIFFGLFYISYLSLIEVNWRITGVCTYPYCDACMLVV